MDAFAQLALMAKAERVFGSAADTFLSFPALSPLTKLPDQLRFGSGTGMTAQDLLEASEFARTTNQIPRSVIAPIEEGEYLWDIVRDVLETARIASRSMSASDLAAYRAAIALLYAEGEDGLRTDSETLKTYKRHRDAVIEAQEEYRNLQSTAEASSDPAVRAQWTEVDEPRLRTLIQEREDAWVTAGSRNEVLAAQQIELSGAASDANGVWDDWKSSLIDDIDLATDTNQVRFALTGFSPSDIFDADDWGRFTLTAEEMTQLVAGAPEPLRDIFASSAGSSEIAKVSFEYRSVALTRPWFRPAIFKARFWRLPDGAEPLSDGADLTRGRCPAYVSALVFARNVIVTYKEHVGGATDAGAPVRFLRLEPAMLSSQFLHLASAAGSSATPVTPTVRVVRDHREAAAAVPVSTVTRATRRLRTADFSVSTATAAPVEVAASAGRPARSGFARSRLRLGSILTGPVLVGGTVTPDPAPTPPPTPTREPAPSREGEVMVLAFICKRTPRSPDPDPTLSWT